MKNKKRITPIGILFITSILFITIFLGGCNNVKKLVYNTNCDKQQLTEIKGKKIVIIANEYDDHLFTTADHLKSPLAKVIIEQNKTKFLSKFGSLFSIEDISNTNMSLDSENPNINNTEFIREILKSYDADGGILVISDYGYTMSSNLLQGLWEVIVGKDKARSMFGSTLESYCFACNIYIVNKEGEVIWNFYGKGYVTPKLEFTLKEFAEAFGGLSPDENKLINAFTTINGRYIEYIKWLVQSDINNSSDTNYFVNYPEENKDKHISIYPASEGSFPPFMNDSR